jgi:hypothetical protein
MAPAAARLAAPSGAACRMNIASSSLMDFTAAPDSIPMLTHALGRRANIALLPIQYRAAVFNAA